MIVVIDKKVYESENRPSASALGRSTQGHQRGAWHGVQDTGRTACFPFRFMSYTIEFAPSEQESAEEVERQGARGCP